MAAIKTQYNHVEWHTLELIVSTFVHMHMSIGYRIVYVYTLLHTGFVYLFVDVVPVMRLYLWSCCIEWRWKCQNPNFPRHSKCEYLFSHWKWSQKWAFIIDLKIHPTKISRVRLVSRKKKIPTHKRQKQIQNVHASCYIPTGPI